MQNALDRLPDEDAGKAQFDMPLTAIHGYIEGLYLPA